MEDRTNHVNIQMMDDMCINGLVGAKVVTMETGKPRGAVVSFHNIHYKVELKNGPLCKRKTITKEILVDLRSVLIHIFSL